jgi:hypothetical protein
VTIRRPLLHKGDEQRAIKADVVALKLAVEWLEERVLAGTCMVQCTYRPWCVDWHTHNPHRPHYTCDSLHSEVMAEEADEAGETEKEGEADEDDGCARYLGLRFRNSFTSYTRPEV